MKNLIEYKVFEGIKLVDFVESVILRDANKRGFNEEDLLLFNDSEKEYREFYKFFVENELEFEVPNDKANLYNAKSATIILDSNLQECSDIQFLMGDCRINLNGNEITNYAYVVIPKKLYELIIVGIPFEILKDYKSLSDEDIETVKGLMGEDFL